MKTTVDENCQNASSNAAKIRAGNLFTVQYVLTVCIVIIFEIQNPLVSLFNCIYTRTYLNNVPVYL